MFSEGISCTITLHYIIALFVAMQARNPNDAAPYIPRPLGTFTLPL
jgi:hypothetical protein